VQQGDSLLLTRAQTPGKPAAQNRQGKVLRPATIPCTLPEVFDSVRPGEGIWFDDGKIGGIIRTVGEDQIRVEITQAKPGGARLLPEKGINLPDTRMRLPALTEKDVADLRFVAANADLVGLSFVRNVSDVESLRARLAEFGGESLGVVLKIETRRAFEMLPDLLLEAMRTPSFGVMIARGDLAVECGYERLAEVQEEILWLCEAAHAPVIWATQVLESLARSGMPSRAEISDAAMGERAECVMLNKGPHVVDAIRVLDNILQRMQAHQSKKRSMLRRLRWWSKAKAPARE
jgi:pyruvate kinase